MLFHEDTWFEDLSSWCCAGLWCTALVDLPNLVEVYRAKATSKASSSFPRPAAPSPAAPGCQGLQPSDTVIKPAGSQVRGYLTPFRGFAYSPACPDAWLSQGREAGRRGNDEAEVRPSIPHASTILTETFFLSLH